MKRIAFVALLIAVLASPAMAGQIQVGYPGSGYGAYQTGQGGEFTLNLLASGLSTWNYSANAKNIGVQNTFQTFCIEGTEFIYPYQATYYAETSDSAKFNNTNPPVADPVSVGTGWLYKQFATGVWENTQTVNLSYNYTTGDRHASAGALQNAIWWLEGEEGITYTDSNIYMKAVVEKFGSAGQAMANGGTSTYHVYALNLWTNANGTGLVQDQLYYHVPDGGATLMLLGGALMGLGALRRKFRV